MKVTYFLPLLTIAAFAADARAGQTVPPNTPSVVIDDAHSVAYGMLGVAYLATSSPQSTDHSLIGCYISAGASSLSGYCGAMDSTGAVTRVCIFTDTAMPALGAFTRDAALSFNWDINNNCTNITVAPISIYSPK